MIVTYSVIHTVTGLTFYAFPVSPTYPLSTWTTNRVLMTENSKMYSCSIDLGLSSNWAVFSGATQPTSYDAALYQDDFSSNGALTSIPVNITPGSISAIHRGDGSNVRLFINENANVVIPTSLDVSAYNLVFRVEDTDRANVLSIPNGSIARTSTSFTVLIPSTVTNQLRDLIWSLRSTTDDKVLVHGTMSVDYVPIS